MKPRKYASPVLITGGTNVVLEQTTALTIGGGNAGDVYLTGLIILKNAVAVTVAVAGLQDEDGDAKTVTFTGSTAEDVALNFPFGLLNTKAAMTLTASVADKVIAIYNEE